MTEEKCLWCSKELVVKFRKVGATRKKFCCQRCRENWHYHHNPKVKARHKIHSKRQNQRIAQSPELKARKYAHFLRWKENNPIRFRLLMREGQRRRLGIKPENFRAIKPEKYYNR